MYGCDFKILDLYLYIILESCVEIGRIIYEQCIFAIMSTNFNSWMLCEDISLCFSFDDDIDDDDEPLDEAVETQDVSWYSLLLKYYTIHVY